LKAFLFTCSVLGFLAAVAVMSATNVLHQIAGLIILLGVGLSFCTAVVLEQLELILKALNRRAPADGPDRTHPAPPAHVIDDSNRRGQQWGSKLAAWLRK
jgi:hypothetical protein